MEKKSKTFWDLYDFLEIFVICSAVVVILFSFVGRLTIVNGQSMENTLMHNDYLIVRSAFYTPKQGDIVVLHDVSKEGIYGDPLVKRVIAVGGQTIDIDFDTWTVTVDGEVIDEPYIKLEGQTLGSVWDYPLTLGENEVFVMGDNRNHSGDSRSFAVGPIDKRCVVGKAIFRVFPFESFGKP